jgi:aryl-alcohol dehydrogenase-like predicted oxidoreductase
MQRITLLQLHNSLTARRGDEPTSITPGDVLGPGGVLEAMEALRKAGVVRHLGLTGLGQPAAVGEVIQSGSFEAIQTPYNVLDPRAGRRLPSDVEDTDDGDVIGQSARQGLGVLAIRVLAGGALAGQPPSAHTLKTLFFPLALFRRDEQRAVQLGRWLAQQPSGGLSLKEVALRYVLFEPRVASAIIGFANAEEVDEAAASLQAGPLPAELSARLAAAEWRSMGLL